MQDFWIFFKIGINHVLDLEGYDHILFLIALTSPYTSKEWQRILILVSIFTFGHTISLALAMMNIVKVNAKFIELLIPITILITALYNLITAGKGSKQTSISFIGFVTFFFGLIHGLGFANYFKNLLFGDALDKIPSTAAFAFGIEGAQIIVVLCVLLLAFVMITLFKFNKRDFTLIMSAFVLGVVVPIIIENPLLKR